MVKKLTVTKGNVYVLYSKQHILLELIFYKLYKTGRAAL